MGKNHLSRNGNREISSDSAAAGLSARAKAGYILAESHKRGRLSSPQELLRCRLRTDFEGLILLID